MEQDRASAVRLHQHELARPLIGATSTQAGLRVRAELDPGEYPTKVKVSDEELASLRITPHDFHGEWNYTLAPRVQPEV